MARTIPADKLTGAIADILEEYGRDVENGLQFAVRKVAKEGAKALRAESKRTFVTHDRKRPYYKGWTSSVETGRRSAQGVIYNKDLPGLPHLLEHGHVNRDGSRTQGVAHIEPIEREVVDAFEKEVISSL